jgi:hypothetical protein
MTLADDGKGLAIKKPSERFNDFPICYLTEHTGGSIRHKGIRAVDCMQALSDLDRDWEKYHAARIREERKKALEEAEKIASEWDMDNCAAEIRKLIEAEEG